MRSWLPVIAVGLSLGCGPLELEPIESDGAAVADATGRHPTGAAATSALVWENVLSVDTAPDATTGGYFVGGCFHGALTLPGGRTIHAKSGERSHFFARIGADGDATFAESFTDRCQGDHAVRLASNARGEAVLVDGGAWRATVGGAVHSYGMGGVLVARYADGALTGRVLPSVSPWEVTAGGAFAAAISPEGTIALTFQMRGPIDVDASTVPHDTRTFLWLSPELETQHEKRIATRGFYAYAEAPGLAFAGDGSLLVGGWFMSHVKFADEMLEAAGGYEGYVMALDAAGEVVRLTRFGADSQVWDLSAAPDGGAWISGEFPGAACTTALGGAPCSATTLATALRLDAAGAEIARANVGDGVIAARPGGGAFVAGGYCDRSRMGDLVLPPGPSGVCRRRSDVFTGEIDGTGAVLSASAFPASRRAYAKHVGFDGTGALLVVGQVRGTVDFGAGPQRGGPLGRVGYHRGSFIARFE